MLIILRDKTLPRFPSLAAGNLLDLRFWSSVILGKYATRRTLACSTGEFWSSVILGKYATNFARARETGEFWSSVILGKYATEVRREGRLAGFGAASFWVSTQLTSCHNITLSVLEQRHSG